MRHQKQASHQSKPKSKPQVKEMAKVLAFLEAIHAKNMKNA